MKLWLVVAFVVVAAVAMSCESPASKPPATAMVADANGDDPAAASMGNESTSAPAPMLMSNGGPATTAPAVTIVTTQPMIGTVSPTTTQPSLDLAAPFVSPIDGFAFRPPLAGIRRYQLGTAEIVGFSYPDKGWDIRVKPVPLPRPMPLTGKNPPGLLELTAFQLIQRDPSAEILKQQVMPFGRDNLAGLIEARYNQGIDRVFGQQVLIPQGLTGYLMVQMVSPGGASDEAMLKEAEARRVFHLVLETFQLIDRKSVREDQDKRGVATEHFYDTLIESRIKQVCVPVQYMRVVRDKKDIGLMCVFERQAEKDGTQGVQVVVYSCMLVPVEPTTKPADDPIMPAPGDRRGVPVGGAEAPGGDGRHTVLQGSLGPVSPAVDKPKSPSTVYSMSDYFMTLDRAHESWSAYIKPGDGQFLAEFGSSDLTTRRALDREEQKRLAAVSSGHDQPPIKIISERSLSVTPARGKTVNEKVPNFCYLPQAMGVLLPRLIYSRPGEYLFGSYVSDIQKSMYRYVEVRSPGDVTLGGVTQRAIPVNDRIGMEGIATTYYITPEGKWIGSINNQTGMEVLPSTPGELKGIWPGFKEYPDPPLPKETPKGTPGSIPAARHSVLEDLPIGR